MKKCEIVWWEMGDITKIANTQKLNLINIWVGSTLAFGLLVFVSTLSTKYVMFCPVIFLHLNTIFWLLNCYSSFQLPLNPTIFSLLASFFLENIKKISSFKHCNHISKHAYTFCALIPFNVNWELNFRSKREEAFFKNKKLARHAVLQKVLERVMLIFWYSFGTCYYSLSSPSFQSCLSQAQKNNDNTV